MVFQDCDRQETSIDIFIPFQAAKDLQLHIYIIISQICLAVHIYSTLNFIFMFSSNIQQHILHHSLVFISECQHLY